MCTMNLFGKNTIGTQVKRKSHIQKTMACYRRFAPAQQVNYFYRPSVKDPTGTEITTMYMWHIFLINYTGDMWFCTLPVYIYKLRCVYGLTMSIVAHTYRLQGRKYKVKGIGGLTTYLWMIN